MKEIIRQFYSEHGGKADRHVSVPAEVTIDLHREADDREQRRQRTARRVLGIGRRDHGRELIREYQLLDQAKRENCQRRGESAQCRRARVFQLRNKFMWLKNRSRDQMRKEQHISQHRLRPVARRKNAAVDIHEVSHEREADERYAERQRQIQQAMIDPEKRAKHVAVDEVGIFEDGERQQQHHKGGSGTPPAFRRILDTLDPPATQIGDRHQDKRDPNVLQLPRGVENGAADDDQPKSILARNGKMQSEIDDKEDKEGGCAEYHDSRALKLAFERTVPRGA